MSRITVTIAVLLAVASCSQALELPPSMGQLEAYARIPLILGQSSSEFLELYEFDMWLSEEGLSETHVRRCGAPPYRVTTHDGYCPFEVPPGRYAILLHQPEWFVRPAVVPNVVVNPGKAQVNVIPSLDYSCVTGGGKLGPWQKPGGPNPWTTAKVFHQTFIAGGASITHAHFRLAASDAPSARVSVHRVKEGCPPDEWEQVGPARVAEGLGPLRDSWVGWRSGEVPARPGDKYAVRVAGEKDGVPADITMIIRRDDIGPGYEGGTAWANGVEQAYDIYGTVSSDRDGLVIPYMRTADIKPGELGGSGVWSQTWIAQGKSLGSVDLLVAWGTSDDTKGVLAEFRIRRGGPAGKIIGVPKRAFTAWWGPGYGFLGAAWQPGEVTLTPGKTYCVECVPVGPTKGYNAAVADRERNSYPDGIAYRDGKAVRDRDLEMTVTEYTASPEVSVQKPRYEPKGRNLLVNGGFENGTPNEQDAQAPEGWSRWYSGSTSFWYGNYGRNGTNAPRVIGGSINGTRIDGGYVQRVAGLSPSKSYCFSGWTSSSALTDLCYLSSVGYDPTSQATDPKASTIVWELTGRRTFLYEQVVLSGIRPWSDSISVWCRGANREVGNLIFTVDFDDFSLVEE